MAIDPRKVRELLRGKRIAVLATVGKDGAPHLTSMWFGYDGGCLTFWTGGDAVKTRNILRDNRVSVLVHKDRKGYLGVRIDGTARVDATDIKREVYAIARRYRGYKIGTEYVDQFSGDLGVIIRVIPQRLYSWDER